MARHQSIIPNHYLLSPLFTCRAAINIMENNIRNNLTRETAPPCSLAQLTIAAEFYLKELAQLVASSRLGVDNLPDSDRDIFYQHLAWALGLIHFMDGQLPFKTAVALTTGEDPETIIEHLIHQYPEAIRQVRSEVRDSWITHH
jgi:hypothetical protein